MLSPGEIVGEQFRVERPLAEGGFGEVYVATQLGTGKARALKVLRPEVARDARTRDRFIQEARIGARIASDHVVEVVAAGIDPARDAPWLAMELLEGETLEDRVRTRGPCSAAEAAAIFGQLGHALGTAHAAGVVHRDLKPENIFVATARRHDVPFTIKVLDFGIARLLAEARDATMSSQAIGSPLWMAPEQLAQGVGIAPATDVWALGLIAFFALSGRSYWQSGNVPSPSVMSLVHEIATAPIVRASERAALLGGPTLPAGFDAWFARCVARDPRARFRDGGEATASLLAVLGAGGLPPTADTRGLAPTAPMPPPSPAKRSVLPWLVGGGAILGMLALGVVVATATGVALFGGEEDEMPPPPAQTFVPEPAPASSSLAAPSLAAPSPAARPSGAATSLVAGGSQSCAQLGASGWWCWGSGALPGERGLVSRAAVPVALAGIPADARLALGAYAGCAIDARSRVRCWGMTVRTIDGVGGGAAPAEIDGLEHVEEVAIGVRFACARTRDGHVECWGDGSSGQLGRGRREERPDPQRVEGLDGVAEIDAGVGFVCARRVEGTVWCWGDNVLGELGVAAGGERATPAPVEGISDAVQLALGSHYACARGRDGRVHCWGGNIRGQLGDGTTRDHARPRPVRDLRDAVDLVAGDEQTCARRADGSWWCWGLDYQSVMIGAGRENVTAPHRMDALAGAPEVALGHFHGCARTAEGAVVCWGNNEQAALGDGTDTSRVQPAPPRF